MTEPLLTIPDVMRLLNVPRTTVYGVIAKRHLVATKIGKQWRIAPSAVDRYLAEAEQRSRPPARMDVPVQVPHRRRADKRNGVELDLAGADRFLKTRRTTKTTTRGSDGHRTSYRGDTEPSRSRSERSHR